MDDPIVYPGEPGASHMHDFFGSTETNAYSTPPSLVGSAGTTCRFSTDHSGYWFPALVMDGTYIQPVETAMYYRGPDWAYAETNVEAIPASLEMIAGDSHATAPQPRPITYWQCGPAYGAVVPKSSTPYDCSPYPGSYVRAQLTFPSCWDGVHRDSADHRSHLAYPLVKGSNICPLTHPVLIPRITAVVNYGIVNGAGATLSSGPGYTFHGDFMNGWDQVKLIQFTDRCINNLVYCVFTPTSESQVVAASDEARPSRPVGGRTHSGAPSSEVNRV
jgi:hypothetical protein